MKRLRAFLSQRLIPLVLAAAALPPALAAEAATAVPAAGFVEIQATRDTIRQLRKGGYVLYFRHGSTDNTRADRVPAVDLNDCATQRPLTEAGRQKSAQVGQAMRKAEIPIGDVLSSPLCRTRDSTLALLGKGSPFAIDNNLIYTANLTTGEKAPIIANTRRLLSAPVPEGSNRLLVAHGPNLMDLLGYFPKEATVVVFRPKGEAGFEYVASILPDSWSALIP